MFFYVATYQYIAVQSNCYCPLELLYRLVQKYSEAAGLATASSKALKHTDISFLTQHVGAA